MFFHASPVSGIQVLEPNISNHGISRVYLSRKRENVLVYLSNAIEKYCKETGFAHEGPWQKWASYGFYEGKLRLDEYYPNAIWDTYKDVSGYIYAADTVPGGEEQEDIPDAIVTGEPVPVLDCEYVPDAYEAILKAAESGLIIIRRYEEMAEQMLTWIQRTVKRQYEGSEDIPTYRHFLRGKFPEILGFGDGNV
ncbi:hypothetical protein AALA61_01860 [Oscillospiraceae bacterium 42-9]